MTRVVPVVLVVSICGLSMPAVHAQLSLVSVEQEIEIGRETNARVLREVPALRDREVATYIGGILANSVEIFFSSHPPPQDRIARLKSDVTRRSGGTRDTKHFQAVKARLRKMAPPRPMPAQ